MFFTRTPQNRIKTPLLRQIEVRECGAVAMGIVLAYYGRYVPLSELRTMCRTSRDGVKANGIIQAARHYGLIAKAYKREQIETLKPPFIVLWKFNHFLVIEGVDPAFIYANDPAAGWRTIPRQEFEQGYSGIAFTFELSPLFQPGGIQPSPLKLIMRYIPMHYAVLFLLNTLQIMLIILGAWLFDAGMDRRLMLWIGSYALLGLSIIIFEHAYQTPRTAPFFNHILQLPAAFFASRYTWEITARIISIDRLNGMLAKAVNNVTHLVIGGLIYGVVLAGISGQMTIGVLLLACLNAGILWSEQQHTSHHYQYYGEKQNIYVNAMMQTHLEDIQREGSEDIAFERLTSAHAASASLALPPFVPGRLLPLLNVIVVVCLSMRMVEHYAFMAVIIGLFFIRNVPRVFELYHSGAALYSLLLRIDDVLEVHSIPAAARIVPAKGVALQQVSFSYGDTPAVAEISLEIKPGECLVLTGRSGCGKSTVLALMAELYIPQTGEVMVGREARIVLVDDIPPYFEGTLAEWLSQDTLSAPIIQTILADTGFGDHDLQRGWDSLSFSEKRSACLARALTLQPTILLLDEAVSFEMGQAMCERGYGVILVTHQLKNIPADMSIVMMNAGRIVERGRHQTLIEQGGSYATLYHSGS